MKDNEDELKIICVDNGENLADYLKRKYPRVVECLKREARQEGKEIVAKEILTSDMIYHPINLFEYLYKIIPKELKEKLKEMK